MSVSGNTIFTGKNNRQTGYLDLVIWYIFSQNSNKIILSLQGEQLTVFVARDKIRAFKLSAPLSLRSSQYLKSFSEKIGDNIKKCYFQYYIMKRGNIVRESVFQMISG